MGEQVVCRVDVDCVKLCKLFLCHAVHLAEELSVRFDVGTDRTAELPRRSAFSEELNMIYAMNRADLSGLYGTAPDSRRNSCIKGAVRISGAADELRTADTLDDQLSAADRARTD